MVGEPLDIDINSADSTLRVKVHGDIDMSTAGQLRTALNDSSDGHRRVLLDLSDVPFMDSSGLHVLIEVAQRQQGHDGTVELIAASDQVRRLVNITNLAGLLSMNAAD